MMMVDEKFARKIIRIDEVEALKLPVNEFYEISTRETTAIVNNFYTSCETSNSIPHIKIWYPLLKKAMDSGIGKWWN